MTTLSVVHGDNGDLIAAVATLWMAPTDRVLDMTYGRGLFWSVYRHPNRKFVDYNGDFRLVTNDNRRRFNDRSFDVVVFDPPYVSKGGRETSSIDEMDDRYGMKIAPKTVRQCNDLIKQGMVEGERLLRPGGRLMVKHMDYISSQKYQRVHHFVTITAEELGLEQVDLFILCRKGSGPQPKKNRDGTPRRQVHSHRSHSYLSVFRKSVG